MAAITNNSQLNLSTKIINTLLSIKPLAEFAKSQARKMIITRANKIGVPWQENVKALQAHDWQSELVRVENSQLVYPDYYLTSFHAYEKGNLDWHCAWEVESAAYSVHSTIYSATPSVDGDRTLRQNYHQVLQQKMAMVPQRILDLGCGVGMSTRALQEFYPSAQMSGLDLSPYFLAVANYQSSQKSPTKINWLHGAAEKTNFPSESYDLVSAFLMFHELPQSASRQIFREAYRLLPSGGYFAFMDMNPQSEVYQKMPRYVFTLLKSTEPYLDEYFSLDIVSELVKVGFESPTIIPISVRHRTVIARKP
jgi:ubiquinone/menaquinone biosynthesis C-methylase UbiE